MLYVVSLELSREGYPLKINDKECYLCVKEQIPYSFFNILQYTGLKDKYGKEIYEGDILKSPDVWKSNKFLISKVEIPNIYYEEEETGFDPEGSEIIGNSYENPELLKEEKI
jgi:hypothetical protein